MTRSFLLTALMCSTLFLAPNAANAAIDAAGAEAVKTMIKSMIEDQIQAAKTQSPSINVKMSGDYVVEPKDTYYAVTTPHMIIDIDGSARHKDVKAMVLFSVDYGSTHLNIMPGSTPNQWRMAIALPSPIRVKMTAEINCGTDKKCKPGRSTTHETTVDQKTTKFQVLWDDAQKMALKSDALIEGIHVKYDGKDVPFTIGSMAWATNAAEKTPGLFDGRSTASIKNIVFDMTGANCPAPCKTSGKGTIGEIFTNGNYTGYDHKMARTFQQKMADMMEAGYDASKPQTPEAFAALWKDIMTYGFNTIDQAQGTIGLRDVSVSISDKPGAGLDTFAIKEFSYGGGISNWKGDKANLSFSSAVEGVVLPNAATDIPGFKVFVPYIPTTEHEKIDITNLPHKKLMEQIGLMGQNFISSTNQPKCAAGTPPEKCASASPAGAQQAQLLGMQAMMTMPQLFAEAGTKVTMHMDGDAPKLTALVDGDFTANAQAVYSGVGKMKAILGGIDALIADLQTAAKDPSATPTDVQSYNNVAAGLTSLQLFGQQGTDAKGNPARTFDFTLDEKGVVKMNGADLSTFGKIGTPTGPDQAPPPSIPPAIPKKP